MLSIAGDVGKPGKLMVLPKLKVVTPSGSLQASFGAKYRMLWELLKLVLAVVFADNFLQDLRQVPEWARVLWAFCIACTIFWLIFGRTIGGISEAAPVEATDYDCDLVSKRIGEHGFEVSSSLILSFLEAPRKYASYVESKRQFITLDLGRSGQSKLERR